MINQLTITETGKLAAKLPVDPIWYCALSAAVKHGCVSEVVSLAAISSIQGDIRVQPKGPIASEASDVAWSHVAHPLSDHITQLNALHAFMRTKAEEKVDLERWCLDHFVFKPAMDEVCQLREQIKNIWTRELKQSYLSLSLAKRTEPGYSTAVRRALAEGLLTRTAVVTDLALATFLAISSPLTSRAAYSHSVHGLNQQIHRRIVQFKNDGFCHIQILK